MSKKQFKAESRRLMELMVNSIYTNKEIFLREIISNASDAIDKLCYLALTEKITGVGREDFYIEIARNRESRTLTVSDNGIGMTREELESNLGVIARSGSLAFKDGMEASEKSGDIDIIGQFGVGFYSAFMVSKKVTVESRKFGSEEAFRWQSSGSDGYTVSPCEKSGAGTTIIMELKDDAEDEDYSRFLDEHTVAQLVKKYSDYIRYPIRMERETRRNINQDVPEKEPEWESRTENETLNSMVPLWQRQKKEVTEEDLNNFYKEKFFDFENPLKSVQIDAESTVTSYKALLFIPARASYDYYTKDYKRGLQLYSSGVLIMDHCEDLVPEHFRFLRGVVDSPDLSLNISRELLQQTKPLRTIASHIEKRVCSELLKMQKDDRETFQKFFSAFGLQLKYGVLADFGAHKEQIQDLLLFPSSEEGEQMTTLKEYTERMPKDQKAIYYATGESVRSILSLPQADRVREKGFEILYFTAEPDEFVAKTLMTYAEKPLQSVNSDDLGLSTEDEKESFKKLEDENKDLLSFIEEALDGAVDEVKISEKLRSHPVCLTAEGHVSFEMEKYLKEIHPENAPRAKRVLELNAGHPLFQKLRELRETDGEKAKTYAKILCYQAELLAGLGIDDPTAYSEMIFGLLY